MAEKRIYKFEDESVEIMQSEEQGIKRKELCFFCEGKSLQKPATAFPLYLTGETYGEVNPRCKAV